MADLKPKIFVDAKRKTIVFLGLCKGCGLCIEKCPQGAIRFSRTDLGYYSTPAIEIDLKKCNVCGICEITCPESAIRIEKG